MGAPPQQRPEKEADVSSVAKRRRVAAEVTNDLDVLDCPVCFQPLRPPIFQCTVGHAICSSCHVKLPDKCCKCCFCSLPTVYSRCHKVEDMIESIKIACSNSNHGCRARISYYQKENHEKGCPYAPCFCPETGCSFSGPTAALMEHFLGQHGALYTKEKLTYGKSYRMDKRQGSTALMGDDGRLFLVKMTMEPICGVISVCCVQPHIAGSSFRCRLALTCTEPSYSQSMEFLTRSTNLHDGFPKDCFPFLVPKVLLRGTSTNSTAMVRVTIKPQ